MDQDFTMGEAYTAMCLWEAFCEGRNDKAAPWASMLGNYGTATCRDHVLSLALACEAAWNAMNEDEQDDAGAFDWEFCPDWLRKNWSK